MFKLWIRLVLSTLDEALEEEPDRKCFRLIGGVLVERTVEDVVPALQTNRDGVSWCHSARLTPSNTCCSDQKGDHHPYGADQVERARV